MTRREWNRRKAEMRLTKALNAMHNAMRDLEGDEWAVQSELLEVFQRVSDVRFRLSTGAIGTRRKAG